MQGLRETLFLLVVGVVAVAVAGDDLVRVVRAMVLPLCAVVVVIAAARLVWFYTSRW